MQHGPQEYLDAVCREDQKVNPLFRFLGARLENAANGQACIRMPVSDNLRQGGGMVAGGILATLADECMAHAVLSTLQRGQTAVTVEMNVRYLRGAHPDQKGDLVARAEVVKEGRSLVVASATVHGPDNRLLVTAGATFAVLTIP